MSQSRKRHDKISAPPVATGANRRLNFKDFTACRLKVLVERMGHQLADLHERFDLSAPQWMMLAALAQHADSSSTEIKNHTAMDKSRVNRASGNLLTRQLVLQRVNVEDKRAHQMRLTGKGRQVYARVEALALAWDDELRHGVSDDDLQRFNRVLTQFENNLTAMELRQAGRRSQKA